MKTKKSLIIFFSLMFLFSILFSVNFVSASLPEGWQPVSITPAPTGIDDVSCNNNGVCAFVDSQGRGLYYSQDIEETWIHLRTEENLQTIRFGLAYTVPINIKVLSNNELLVLFQIYRFSDNAFLGYATAKYGILTHVFSDYFGFRPGIFSSLTLIETLVTKPNCNSDSSLCLIAGYNMVLESVDQGRTWTKLTDVSFGPPGRLEFVGDKEWLMVKGSQFWQSEDDGYTWKNVRQFGENDLFDVIKLSTEKYVVVGHNSFIGSNLLDWKPIYTYADEVGNEIDVEKIPKGFVTTSSKGFVGEYSLEGVNLKRYKLFETAQSLVFASTGLRTVIVGDKFGRLAFKIFSFLPEGVAEVTGTVELIVNATGIIQVNGGAMGGIVTLEDAKKIKTFEITVPANTISLIKMEHNGLPRILSTNTMIDNPLILKNVDAIKHPVYVESGNAEALVEVPYQQSFELFFDGWEKKTGIKASLTNIWDVQFSISAGASSDCDPVTCANLGGHCDGNWCMPNKATEFPFLTKDFLVATALGPRQDIIFGTEKTPSLDDVLSLSTKSDLEKVGLKYGIDELASLRMTSTPANTTALAIPAEVRIVFDKATATAGVFPYSQNIKISSRFTALEVPWNYYYFKARKLGQGKIIPAAPAKYQFDMNGDTLPDIVYNSKPENKYFEEVESVYPALSVTGANGINAMVFAPVTKSPLFLTITFEDIIQTKTLELNDATAFNFVERGVTGSAVSRGESGGLALLISLLTLAGIIVLIALQLRRKSVDW